MSTQYECLKSPDLYAEAFSVTAPPTPERRDVWPRQTGVFIRLKQAGEAAPPSDAEEHPPEKPEREAVLGQFGLVPTWVKSASDAKLRSTKLVNARAETVTTSNNFRSAWLAARRCIVPMMAFQEDDLRSGKTVPTRIARVDGRPMGVAGLWESWMGADGTTIVSFCLLTVNANSHALMHRYQQPGAEKRMPAVLNEGGYDAWLTARPEKAREFLRAYPANWLTANPVQK
ncbi:SOS response-associated peptidase [Hydrogenophaga sp.]|uniref:SOS response-associated peptidase n=1 Tax=Hydrogenophaga sp. TaxID=1904254 RepID=UPI00271C17D2|nr:SOS response-associated peptidase family protein [Hydrogenophaga sp.]MDO8906512.1 SOS response-associated peptidase family protein [Hydrogenophaga sp.]